MMTDSSGGRDRPPLRPAQIALRLCLIAAIAGSAATAFAYTAGWLSPGRIDGSEMIDSLQASGGRHPGYRRAHAKGLCVAGHFTSSGLGQALSRAKVFAPGDTPVIGRFSVGTSDPASADGKLFFHALALSFQLANGEVWRTALDHTPIFPVANAADFIAFQRAMAPDPATGKPNPDKRAAFLAAHPETRAFIDWLKTEPLPSSFANGTYYSINAFRFTDGEGQVRNVRWSLVPEAPFAALDKNDLASLPPNFLFEDLVTRLASGPLRWHLTVTIAQPGDPTSDATKTWPNDRETIDVGVLSLEEASLEADGPCRDITFDPTILPDGISISDDPLLPARSAAYASSLYRRDGEPFAPSVLAKDPAIREALQ